MAKKQTSLRLTDLTSRQLEALTKAWGMNQTEVITVLVDRAAQNERLITMETQKASAIEAIEKGIQAGITNPVYALAATLPRFGEMKDWTKEDFSHGWFGMIVAPEIFALYGREVVDCIMEDATFTMIEGQPMQSAIVALQQMGEVGGKWWHPEIVGVRRQYYERHAQG